MKKQHVFVLLFCSIISFFPFNIYANSEQTITGSIEAVKPSNTPESFVKAFYQWYFKADNGEQLPENLPEILDFVDTYTLEHILRTYKLGLPGGNSAYFTKVASYDHEEWRSSMFIHPSTDLGQVTIVPVSFGENRKINIVLFLHLVDGQWRITKAADSRPYP